MRKTEERRFPRHFTTPAVSETIPGGADETMEEELDGEQIIQQSMPNGYDLVSDEPLTIKSQSFGFQSTHGKAPPPSRKKRKNKYENIIVERTYTPNLHVFDEEIVGAATPSDNEDFDNVRESLEILKSSEHTLVYGIIIDKSDESKNIISAIRCCGSTAFGGYAYDRGRDAYLVESVDFFELGEIPFSLVLSMPKVGTWQAKVPIPEQVMEKHLSPNERKKLEGYRETYPSPRYEINFIQMLDCL